MHGLKSMAVTATGIYRYMAALDHVGYPTPRKFLTIDDTQNQKPRIVCESVGVSFILHDLLLYSLIYGV